MGFDFGVGGSSLVQTLAFGKSPGIRSLMANARDGFTANFAESTLQLEFKFTGAVVKLFWGIKCPVPGFVLGTSFLRCSYFDGTTWIERSVGGVNVYQYA